MGLFLVELLAFGAIFKGYFLFFVFFWLSGRGELLLLLLPAPKYLCLHIYSFKLCLVDGKMHEEEKF